MEIYDLVDVYGKTFETIQNNSCQDAPWKNLPGSPMLFLRKGMEAGLKWKIHSDVLAAYIEPKTKAQTKRQEQARQDISWSANMGMAPSGIFLFSENEAGEWKRDDEEDEGTFSPNQDLLGKEKLLAELMEVFWPEIPPLAWTRLTEILVCRDFEKKSRFYGGKTLTAEDYLDFGKAYRTLLHVGKLEPQEAVDWEKIANPPTPAQKAGRKP